MIMTVNCCTLGNARLRTYEILPFQGTCFGSIVPRIGGGGGGEFPVI